ncbi:hypothetical protein [Embleya sp. NBC_00896]|uniref:hypothetical protein n=1 Tax=Embleya sp. NBC_00896 TaxID=2975961 RepID=UPI002F91BCF6|nr:hypothetical protein OG928_44050 [Embleya sp. NBC_00896]
MASIRLNNDTAAPLGIWIEPWGTDHWMKPQEIFTVVADDPQDPPAGDVPFDVVFHEQGVSVHVNLAYQATVYDGSGAEVHCGHQRPLEVMCAWIESAEVAEDGRGALTSVEAAAREARESQ